METLKITFYNAKIYGAVKLLGYSYTVLLHFWILVVCYRDVSCDAVVRIWQCSIAS